MRVVDTIQTLRAALATAPHPLGLVATMGMFHDGHLSLMRRARHDCQTVVASVFVNPTQFGPSDDLSSYPRDEARDTRLAAAEEVDFLFVPTVAEIYPQGFDTSVAVGGLSETLCGDPARRGPDHFRAVATIVTKLLNIVSPDIAYLGQKDAQQALVVRKLVRDLDMPVRIELCPTVRDRDGLALSSRNAYLAEGERASAGALSRALAAAEATVAAGERDGAAVLAAAAAELDAADVEPEYLELRRASDLAPVERVNGSTLLAVAARIGNARLIDNTILGDR